MRILEEQRFVREMAEGLADPNDIKSLFGSKHATHLLGIELDELNFTISEAHEILVVGCTVAFGSVSVGDLCCCCLGQTPRDFDLLSRDGDSSDGSPKLGGKMARCTTNTTANIEDTKWFGGSIFFGGRLEL